MIPMDAEGTNWVGNIYQKFEALCLDVEEVIYEDTIKYMENQVQIVGDSVKTFYSDVNMQDLYPPFSSDTDEIAVSCSPVVNYSDVNVCRTSSVIKDVIFSSCLNAKYENSESQRKKKNSGVIAVVNKDVPPPQFLVDFMKTENNCRPEELVINKNLEKKKLPQNKMTAESISTGSDAGEALSLSEELKESEVHCPDANKLSSVQLHMVVLDKYRSEERIYNMLTSSSTNFAEEQNHSWGSRALETEVAAETDKEMMLRVDKLKLEETCVLVSKDDFHFVSQAGLIDDLTRKSSGKYSFQGRNQLERRRSMKS